LVSGSANRLHSAGSGSGHHWHDAELAAQVEYLPGEWNRVRERRARCQYSSFKPFSLFVQSDIESAKVLLGSLITAVFGPESRLFERVEPQMQRDQ